MRWDQNTVFSSPNEADLETSLRENRLFLFHHGVILTPEMSQILLRSHAAAINATSSSQWGGFFQSPPERRRIRRSLGAGNSDAATQQFLFSDSVPRQQPAQMPKQSLNAKELARLADNHGFDKNSIPENFCCPLSGEIMDDPVADPTRGEETDERFEKAWLVQAIKTCKGKSPYTRKDVDIDSLVTDAQRKTKIEEYMQERRSEFNSKLGLD